MWLFSEVTMSPGDFTQGRSKVWWRSAGDGVLSLWVQGGDLLAILCRLRDSYSPLWTTGYTGSDAGVERLHRGQRVSPP